MTEPPPYADNNRLLDLFFAKANKFLELTNQYVYAGINPGGYYNAVWCRDASYILKDWFLAGRFRDVIKEILFIWSHQIIPRAEKIIYGRGSPEMEYISHLVKPETEKSFEGALPTTIFGGFSEVYSQNPDIDSTALMISVTSWILDNYLKSGQISTSTLKALNENLKPTTSHVISEPSVLIDFVVPRLLKAIDYLKSRDVDGDGLLEQGHNEDWMDTLLRAGKIVYSQASWILALSNLSSLLSEIGIMDDATRLTALANKTIRAVEHKLWQEKEGTYIDLQEQHPAVVQAPLNVFTQDVSLYLVALTETSAFNREPKYQRGAKYELEQRSHQDSNTQRLQQEPTEDDNVKLQLAHHANSTLDGIRKRMWQDDKWPLVTEVGIKRAGTWILNPNVYHNHTFWPWTTGIEMLARSRLERFQECSSLFSVLISGNYQNGNLAFYEWVDPVNKLGKGAYPFRTGISAIRITLLEILQHMRNKEP